MGPKTSQIKLSEAQFQKQVVDFLERAEGWRTFHLEYNFSEKKQRAFGEVGMPDLLCIRYLPVHKVLWLEMKTAKGKPSAVQLAWHTHERKCGAMTAIAGADFPADIDSFIAWYRASGLARA